MTTAPPPRTQSPLADEGEDDGALAPVAVAERPSRMARALRWGTALTASLLIVAVGAALTEGEPEGEAPPPADAEAAPSRPPLAEGEWLRLVGPAAADPAEEEARPAGWGVLVPERDRTVPAVWPAPADGETPGALTVLRRLAERAAGRLALASAGGEVRLAGSPLPPWLWASVTPEQMVAVATRRPAVTLPPALDGYGHHVGPAAWVDGVNYADPAGVGLPLLRTGGLESLPVSAHFRVGDFTTRDGAPYARIAGDLVAGLEGMRALVGPLTIISGYRHPHYNARPSVGGARYSRHQSGQAADVWSPTQTTVELARAAIQAMGCGIGIGLGATTIHVDVRGYLSTWTYRGAPLDGDTFDRWIRDLCGDAAVPASPARRPSGGDTWLALAGGGTSDGEEVVHLSEEAVVEAVVEAEAAVAPPPGLDAVVRRDLAAFARAAYGREGMGVVVVDLRDGEAATGEALVRRARYARAGTPEVHHLGLRPLIGWVESHPPGDFFVYAVRQPGGRVATGVAPTAPGTAPAIPAQDTPPAASRTVALAPPAGPSGWLLVVASGTSLDAAEDALARHRAPLRNAGLGAILRADREGGVVRYDVVVGPFGSEADAERARTQAEDALPVGARIVRLGG